MAPAAKKDHSSFLFQTGDVAAICDLMYGLRDLVETVRFNVTEEGINIGETACQDNLFLFARFLAERFTKFKCVGETTISFYPEHLHKVLNNHQQRDVMVCEFTSKKEARLLITKYPHGDDTTVEEYEIPLLAEEPMLFSSPKREVDYLLAFNSGILSTILSGLNSIEKDFEHNWVTIHCTPDQVRFSMDHGCMIGKAQFTLLTNRGDAAKPTTAATTTGQQQVQTEAAGTEEMDAVERVEVQTEVSHQYRLQFLHQMLKCFSITKGGIFMYVSKDYPLVFEIKVGSLGELKAALMFRDMGNEDE